MSRGKVSRTMIMRLEDARDHGDPWQRVRGQSQHGGAHGTMVALIRRGLLDTNYEITEGGRALLDLYAKEESPGLGLPRATRDAGARDGTQRRERRQGRARVRARLWGRVVKRWTKKDIRSLCGAIDAWWMGMELYLRPGITREKVFAAMPAGERAKICAAHFRAFGAMLEERAGKSADTARHAREHPTVWGKGTDEIVARFERLSAKDAKAAASCRALAARVDAEGLPSDVEAYIPGSKKGT